MPNQLKILIISSQYPPIIGGGGSHVAYLAGALSLKEGVQVHVLTESNPCQGSTPGKNVVVHTISFKHTKSLHYEGAIEKGLGLCREIKPDIIHGQHIAGSLIGLHLKASFKIPLVVTLHKTPKLLWDETITRRAPLYSYIKLLSQLKIIDLFIAGSQIFKRELRDFGVSTRRIKLIYHGIPIKWFKWKANDKMVLSISKRLKLSPADTLIICPSRLDRKRKMLDVFVRAAGGLKRTIKKENFIFLITGTAKDKEGVRLKEDLQHIAAQEGIEKDHLKFMSFKFDELPALHRLAKACVLPAIKEGLGLVLLEALVVRTPVVGANTIGITEVIKTNEKHGLLFEPGDHVELEKQLVKLFTDDILVQKLKREGSKRVKKYFNASLMADRHLKIYRELANKKGQQ